MLNNKFTFIDLFAGVGGFRLALEEFGGACVFSSDYDKHSQITYEANFKDKPHGDINIIKEQDIPSHEILCGGFPCQPFSIAGVSKLTSLGRKHGFDNEKQGNLFFEIMRIVNHHRPKVLFLENVKNLKTHDGGNTWNVIYTALEKAGYNVFSKIVDGAYYVPQHRERILIVCFRKDIYPNIEFTFPKYPEKRLYELNDMLQTEFEAKYTLSDHLWNYLQQRKIDNKAKGKGFGFGIVDLEIDKITRTLSARYHKDGSEILIKQKGKNPRRLTPRECARLQGYPESFVIPVSDTQAYRQFGNSVVVPALKAVFGEIQKTINNYAKGTARKQQIDLFSHLEELDYAA